MSLEVSPVLAHDTASSLAAAKDLHERAGLPNLFIKIPGTKEGQPAIEESIFAGIPVNVTLLFSREQYLAAGRRCKVSTAVRRWPAAGEQSPAAFLAQGELSALDDEKHEVRKFILDS